QDPREAAEEQSNATESVLALLCVYGGSWVAAVWIFRTRSLPRKPRTGKRRSSVRYCLDGAVDRMRHDSSRLDTACACREPLVFSFFAGRPPLALEKRAPHTAAADGQSGYATAWRSVSQPLHASSTVLGT